MPRCLVLLCPILTNLSMLLYSLSLFRSIHYFPPRFSKKRRKIRYIVFQLKWPKLRMYAHPLLGDESNAYLGSLGSDLALCGYLALPSCLGDGNHSHESVRFSLRVALGEEGGHRRLRWRCSSLAQRNAKRGTSVIVK